MPQHEELPRQLTIPSEILGKTFVFRRRRVKDTLAINAAQTQFVGGSPIMANLETQRLSYALAELSVLLVEPVGFDWDIEEEDEFWRIVGEVEKFVDSFRAATKARVAALGAEPDQNAGVALAEGLQSPAD